MPQRPRQSIHNKFTGINNVLPAERLSHQEEAVGSPYLLILDDTRSFGRPD